jgi:hypothetical protein
VKPVVLAALTLVFSISMLPSLAQAEGPAPAAPAAETAAVAPPAAFAPKDGEKQAAMGKSRKSRGVGSSREKETEGTEAYDRFKADTVLKSKYELDGKSLEVDPD